jgi:hypothetical protein
MIDLLGVVLLVGAAVFIVPSHQRHGAPPPAPAEPKERFELDL